MANFKVGDQAKLISTDPVLPANRGRVVRIVGLGLGVWDWTVEATDGKCFVLYGGGFGTRGGANNCWLVPLTDPSADSFIERVKSWGPLEENMTEDDKIDKQIRELTR